MTNQNSLISVDIGLETKRSDLIFYFPFIEGSDREKIIREMDKLFPDCLVRRKEEVIEIHVSYQDPLEREKLAQEILDKVKGGGWALSRFST